MARAGRAVVVGGLALLVLMGGVLPGPARAQGQAATVLVTRVEGIITPVLAEHLEEALARAVRDGALALLVELDTPGGLDASMRRIVQAFLGAEVPVIVYVAPPGARAASAGAIVTMAAHVAAMAPGTAIGAATPVDLQGGDVSEKVVNDAAAYAVSVAEERGRNAAFAEEAVREGRSVPAREAVALGVVDLLAGSRAELLRQIDGTRVRLGSGRETVLRTRGAAVVEYGLSFPRRVLQWLADPNLAFLFISLGTLAILYELANPGIGGAGIVGAILLVLAFASLSVLPVNVAGVLLLLLAAALFVGELFVPGTGVLAAGGAVSLVLGGLLLFRGAVGVDPAVLLPSAGLAGLGAVAIGRAAWRTRRLPAAAGAEALVGRRAEVRSADGGAGQVYLEGEWWSARSRGAPLQVGKQVRVVGVEGLKLIVEPEEEA